MVLRDGINY